MIERVWVPFGDNYILVPKKVFTEKGNIDFASQFDIEHISCLNPVGPMNKKMTTEVIRARNVVSLFIRGYHCR